MSIRHDRVGQRAVSKADYFFDSPSVAGAAAVQLFNSVTFGLFHPAAVMFAAQHARRKEQYVLSQLLYSICAIGTAKILGALWAASSFPGAATDFYTHRIPPSPLPAFSFSPF